MKLNLVNPVPKAIVRPQHRRILVRLETPGNRLLAAHPPAELDQALFRPACALPSNCLLQNGVRREKIVIREGR